MTTDALRTAIAWHLRLRDADEAEWSTFVEWLEACPDHRTAFDEVSVTDRLAIAISSGSSANDNEAPPGGWWKFAMMGSVAAAALALTFGWSLRSTQQPEKYAIIASSDQVREVAIGPQDRARLEPGTQLTLDHANPRYASLGQGQARFEIRHNPAHPFRLELGDHALIDTGTVFTAKLSKRGIVVTVDEGGVVFDPGAAAVTIQGGQRLEFDRGSNTAQLSAVRAKSVLLAAPTSMSFNNVPLHEVTAALARATGERIILDKGLAARRFTGVMSVTGIAMRDVPHLAEATGTVSRRDDEHWVLAPSRNHAD